MRLNHLNLTVSNVLTARVFFETYLEMKALEGTSDDATFLALNDGSGFVLTLMQAKTNVPVVYPKSFHIGFTGHGVEKTQALYERLKEDGYEVHPPGHYREGEFYFSTPFGITIQVS